MSCAYRRRAAEPDRSARPASWWRRTLPALVLVTVALLTASGARADRQHHVRPGQTLAEIAHHYGVTVGSLMAANGMTRHDVLRPGQTLLVPEHGVVYVQSGQTLSSIARDHHITVAALAHLNHLRHHATLRKGQRLLLPGFEPAQVVAQAERRWGRPRHPGVVTMVRIATHRRLRIRLLDRRGRPRRLALHRIERLFRYRGTGPKHRIVGRLLQLLTRVSNHFGGRTLYIVSGYRVAGGYTRRESRHVSGHAVDFRIGGVPNTVLRDYCRTLGNVGVGYYPRSTFVHLDARASPAYWVDWSRPGQRPTYRRPGEGPPPDDSEPNEGADVHDDGSEPAGVADPQPGDLGDDDGSGGAAAPAGDAAPSAGAAQGAGNQGTADH